MESIILEFINLDIINMELLFGSSSNQEASNTNAAAGVHVKHEKYGSSQLLKKTF